jgi:predicted transcriptional regulator
MISMQKGAESDTNHKRTKRGPASSVESRENQLISLAVDLAEKQLMEGTASSQVITHYLRLGSTKERLEKEALEKKVKLLEAKTESLQSAKNTEELYRSAIEAMMSYGGHKDEP